MITRKKSRTPEPKLKMVRAKQLLNRFSRKNILVFGDVGLDQYTQGRVTRISPEAPIPIVEVTQVSYKLGLAANVADNVVELGGSAALVGVIGKDNAARSFCSILEERSIDQSFLIEDRLRPTILKERVVAENQQVVRIDHEKKGALSNDLLKKLEDRLSAAIKKADCIIVEDYAKGLVSSHYCEMVINEANRLGIPVLVDPNLKSPLRMYRGCTLMTPNTTEAEHLTGVTIDSHNRLKEAGHRLLQELASPYAIITRGIDGMAIFIRGESEPVLIPTFAREVFDVSGAGDTVIATMALAMVAGANVVEAALLANYAAGVEVGKSGTATVSRAELLNYMRMLESQQSNKR
jgi:D-beta-D-heptose 7-phosphate kinase/D-beta-D-heptose 1-phosphate adenosyltransferase